MARAASGVSRAEVEQARQLVLAQDAARTALALQAAAMARQAVTAFGGWYDTDQITEWAGGLARRVESLQRSLARSTDAYLARIAGSLTGRTVRPVGVVDVTALRAGVTHAGAYARSADVYRYQQAQFDRFAVELARAAGDGGVLEPPDIVDPVEAAVTRAEAVTDVDTQLAVREQSRRFMESQRDIVGWRRVIHPERSKGGTCGLCAAASTRLYGKTEPIPIHDRCKCVPMQVYDRADVAAELNRLDLAQLYEDAGRTTNAASLKRTRYKVTEHGELGPVLHAYDQPLRDRGQVRRDTRRVTSRAKTATEKRAAVRQVLASQELALPKVRVLAQGDPARWGEYESRLNARVDDLRRQLAA